MRYHSFGTICAITNLFLATVPRADAQWADLRPGAHIRVRAPAMVTGRLEGTVIHRSDDAVTLTTARDGAIAVPLSTITAAEVNRARSRGYGAVKGLTWGSGIGLVAGVLGAIVADAGSDPCGAEPCGNDWSSGEIVAGSFVTGALLGTTIGAIVGADRWEHLTIPAQVAISQRREGPMGGLPGWVVEVRFVR